MAELHQISEIQNLSSEKWVKMNGKIVPIMKLERLAREDLDVRRILHQLWLKTPDCPLRDDWLPRSIELLDMAEKKLEQILFLRDTSPSLPSPCRVKIACTDDESSELLLIPPYFFAEIEDDDSFELNLIPPFFFIENEGVNSLHGVGVQFEEIAKSDMNVSSKLIQAKIDGVKDFEMLNCFKFFEELCKYPEYLNESFFLHNKLLQMDCFGLRFDYHRFFFDRGKCPVISSLTYAKFILHLRLSLGYDSNLRFINLVPRLCPTDVTTVCAKKMFVQMSKKDKLLLHLFARVITIEISCANLARSKDIIVLENKLNCKDYVTLLFDRGKEIELSLRTCVIECSGMVLTIDIYLKLLGDYYRILVPKLIPEHDYWSASLSHRVSSATWQMLDKIFEIDIACLKSKSVSSMQSLIDGRVFDRGKEFGIITEYTYYTGDYAIGLGLTASCLFVLYVGSLVRGANKRNLAYKLFLRHGFRSHSSSMNYILLVFKTGDLGDVFLGCLQMLAICRTVIFLLQLEFCLFHEIAVHCLDSLVVNQIHFVSFECVFKVLMFNTFTILHHGFLYLQSWSLFHIVIWIHMDQGTWFNQLAGTSAFFSQASSQMSQVVSSAGVFSYENLIFVLTPSLGYHSDFSAIHLHVRLCITDADIVDGTLTITMVARTGILSHLAESVLWRLNCGNTDFLLQLTLGHGLLQGTDIPVTKFSAPMIHFLHSAGDFVLFRSYFRTITTTVLRGCLRLFRMEFFLHYPLLTSVIYGSVTTLGEGIQVYPYETAFQSSYCAGLKSYDCRPLLNLVYHTMRGYIKFAFLREVVGTESLVTVHYTLYVLVCSDAHILLTLLTIILTRVYFFIYTILLTFICGSLPATEYIRFIFDRGKEIENVEMWSSYASNLSKLYFTSCLLTSNGLNFTDPCAGKSAHGLILEFGYHLLMWFGLLNVFEFVIHRESFHARQRVSELPHQVGIPWFILTLLLARKECGSVPQLHIIQKFCLFARIKSDNQYFMVATGCLTPPTQSIWTPPRVF